MNQIFLNKQEKSDLKKQQVLFYQNVKRQSYLASLKSGVEKLDRDQLLKIPSALSKLKSNGHNLDVNKWKTIPIDFKN